MAVTNLITDAINSAKSGSTGSGSTEPSSEELGVEVVTDSSSISASDSTMDDVEEKPEQTADETAAASGTSPKETQKPSTDKETITVSDDQGNKRKVEIDYSNRASIKKAFELMHGARKWQAERDRATATEKEIRAKYETDRKVLDALEAAYEQRGELGVIDLIAGKQGASDEFVRRQIERAKFLEKASPAEKEQLAQKERLEQLEKQLAKQEKEGQSREERVKAERQAAEIETLKSRVHPSFEKYRFDGKLGDEATEDMFDQMLWNTAMSNLKPYEEKGLEITREMVEKEFRNVSTTLSKRINMQAEKRATKAVEQKKTEATENAQSATNAAYKKGGSLGAEARDLINKGDFKSLISNWSKYGKSLRS